MRVGVGLLLLAAAGCSAGGGLHPTPERTTGLVVEEWTEQRCRLAVTDPDTDGIDDGCELALARAFAPELLADARDCAWIPDARSGRLGGGYLFAVGDAPDGRAVRIAYLLAYFRDCGWHGLPCATRGAGCSAHDGDSELIVVEVRHDRATARWLTEAVFLSAHCFGRAGGRCRWYGADDLRFEWLRGTPRSAPRVWVARGKHANYPSRRDCDSGHWFYDSCDQNSVVYRFPVVMAEQNIGSRTRMWPERHRPHAAGCLTGEDLVWTTGAERDATECFWDDRAAFRGWQRPARGEPATPYGRVLRLAAGF